MLRKFIQFPSKFEYRLKLLVILGLSALVVAPVMGRWYPVYVTILTRHVKSFYRGLLHEVSATLR